MPCFQATFYNLCILISKILVKMQELLAQGIHFAIRSRYLTVFAYCFQLSLMLKRQMPLKKKKRKKERNKEPSSGAELSYGPALVFISSESHVLPMQLALRIRQLPLTTLKKRKLLLFKRKSTGRCWYGPGKEFSPEMASQQRYNLKCQENYLWTAFISVVIITGRIGSIAF